MGETNDFNTTYGDPAPGCDPGIFGDVMPSENGDCDECGKPLPEEYESGLCEACETAGWAAHEAAGRPE